MRAQSAIEFLTTYSFLFIILGVIVSVIVYISVFPQQSIPSLCSSFSGPSCNYVSIYSNKSAGYSAVTFSLSNSQSVPINISNTLVTVKSFSAIGACTPSFIYPGQWSTCTASIPAALVAGVSLLGYYSLNAQYCNSNVFNLSNGKCAYELISYGGSFTAAPTISRQAVFSVIASQSPAALQLLPFSSIAFAPNSPVEPNNFTQLQNGAWSTPVTNGVVAFAYAANNAVMLGQTYFGYKTIPFPSALSSLQNGNVACAAPYNSVFSIASTTLYVSSSVTATVNMVAGGAMEFFYKQYSAGGIGQSWNNRFSGQGWVSQSPTIYGPNTVSLNTGLYSIEAVWMNPCGGGGEVLKLYNLPN